MVVLCYKRESVSALLGFHHQALPRMRIHADQTVKTPVITMRKPQIHSHNIRKSGVYIKLKAFEFFKFSKLSDYYFNSKILLCTQAGDRHEHS